MRLIVKEQPELRYPTEWRRYFALLPKRLGDTWIWLEWYESRLAKKPDFGITSVTLWVEERLPDRPEEVWEVVEHLR